MNDTQWSDFFTLCSPKQIVSNFNQANLPQIETPLPDIQNLKEGYPPKYIPKVGSRNIIVPLMIQRQDGSWNPTKGVISLYTDLTPQTKGTNMSRYRILVEDLVANRTHEIDKLVDVLLDECVTRLQSQTAHVKIKFDYFLKKQAPISKIVSHMDYQGYLEGRRWQNGQKDFYLHAQVLYCSLCPCSKEIAKFGAHNQQSYANITVQLRDISYYRQFGIENIISIVEGAASAPMINALKRPDEAYMTELAYLNPVFVEDMVRKIAEQLDKHLDKEIVDYVAVVNHYESIHSSVAVAIINAQRQLH